MTPSSWTDQLGSRLLRLARYHGILGRAYEGLADVLTLVAIVTGFVVSMLLYSKRVSTEFVTIFASVVPGVALTIVKALKLGHRARWHRERGAKLLSLHSELVSEVKVPSTVAGAFIKLLGEQPDFDPRDLTAVTGATPAAQAGVTKSKGSSPKIPKIRPEVDPGANP